MSYQNQNDRGRVPGRRTNLVVSGGLLTCGRRFANLCVWLRCGRAYCLSRPSQDTGPTGAAVHPDTRHIHSDGRTLLHRDSVCRMKDKSYPRSFLSPLNCIKWSSKGPKPQYPGEVWLLVEYIRKY